MRDSFFGKIRLARKFFIAAVFLAGYGIFYWGYSQMQAAGFLGKTIPVEDVTEKVIITLSKKPGADSGARLFIRIRGELSGIAVIHQGYDGSQKASYAIGPGKVDLNIKRDWPHPKCSLTYEPQDVAAGHLMIRYRFG